MASYTIFGATGDGVIESTNATYSTARSGSGLAATTVNVIVGQTLDAGTYGCWEGFFAFDTSSIVDAETVTAVTFGMYGLGDFSTTDFTLTAADSNWGATLTTADWVAGASLAGLTTWGTLTSVGWGVESYNSLTGNSSFMSGINKTGSTYFLVYSSRHSGNNTPTGTESVQVYGADEAGTTKDPKLDITTSAFGFPMTVAIL